MPAAAPVAVPAELPLVTREDTFDVRWALERRPDAVRAVGIARTLTGRATNLTLGLFGIDENGRLVSQTRTPVRFDFAHGPAPFEMTLRPTGREARFELHVVESNVRSGLDR